MRRYLFPAFLLFLFVLPGCGIVELSQEVSMDGEQTQEESNEIPGSWVTYKNIAYGYEISYPQAAILFEKVAQVDDQAYILTPTEESSLIKITDATAAMLTQTDVNELTIQVIDDARSGHEWISQHLDEYYPGGVGGQTNGELAGKSAIIIRGTGSENSPEKFIVLEHADKVFVISYEQSSITFDEILETFSFSE